MQSQSRLWRFGLLAILLAVIAIPAARAGMAQYGFLAEWSGETPIARIVWMDDRPAYQPTSIVWTACTPTEPANQQPGNCADITAGPELVQGFSGSGTRHWVRATINLAQAAPVTTEWRVWAAPPPAQLVIERPQPDHRVASIEVDRAVSNVDWQLCQDAQGNGCDPVHTNHSVTEAFDGLFLSGVVSATVSFSNVAFPSETVKGLLPSSQSLVNFSRSPVNKGQLTIASLSSSQQGSIQSTNWRINNSNVNIFPAGNPFELEIDTTAFPLASNTLTVTETWLDAGSGLTSYYRSHATLQVQAMPQNEVSCGFSGEVNVACNTSWPGGSGTPVGGTYLWNGGGLMPTGNWTSSVAQFKYQSGTYTVTVEGRTPDPDTSRGYYVEWTASTVVTLYPLGIIDCTTHATDFECISTEPQGVVGKYDHVVWTYVTDAGNPEAARLSLMKVGHGVTLESAAKAIGLQNFRMVHVDLSPGEALHIPRDCNAVAPLVWLEAKKGDTIIWEVFVTIVHDTGGCVNLPLVQG